NINGRPYVLVLGDAANVFFQDLPLVGIEQVAGGAAVFDDAVTEGVHIICDDRGAAGVLHLDQVVPGVEDVRSALFVEGEIAVFVRGQGAGTAPGNLVLLVEGPALGDAIGRHRGHVAQRVQGPALRGRGAGNRVVDRAAAGHRQGAAREAGDFVQRVIPLAGARGVVEFRENGVQHIILVKHVAVAVPPVLEPVGCGTGTGVQPALIDYLAE